MDNKNINTSVAPVEQLVLTQEWDKVFPKSDKTDHRKVTFVNRYGITLAASWKGLDLTLFGTGAHGNDIFNCINKFDRQASNKLKEVFYDNRWTPQNTSGTVPRAGAQNMDKYQFSDAMVYDGSFFKIKQIQLGYSFPKKWLRKAFIQNLRLYVSLDDFVTFTKYPGFDPEAATNDTRGMGIDKGSYPGSKKVVFGLNLEF